MVYDDDHLESRTRITPDGREVTVYNQHDAYGRVTEEKTVAKGFGQELTTVTKRTYDHLGNLSSTTDADGRTTRYDESPDGRTSTVTLPGGATRITTKNPDGTTKSITGTAVVAQHFSYGVDPATGETWSQTNLARPDSPRWSRSSSNLLGQSTKTERPGFGKDVVIVSNQKYDRVGRAIASHSAIRTADGKLTPVQSPQLVSYDTATGEPLLSGLDTDANGKLDPASNDRIAKSESTYEQLDGAWWQTTKSWTYPRTNDATPILTAHSRRRLTGLGTEHPDHGILVAESAQLPVEESSVSSALSVVKTYRNRDKAKVTTITTTGAGLVTTQVTESGLATAISQSGGLGSVPAGQSSPPVTTKFRHDPLGRRVGVIDPRTGESKTEFSLGGQVLAQLDAAGNRNRFAYDDAGRLRTTTNPLGKSQTYGYNDRGQKTGSWGQTDYPTVLEFDDYGQTVALHTFRQEPDKNAATATALKASAPSDKTTWHLDESTGLLVFKEYADGKGPTYEYTPDGKLKTRTWARGVKTHYAYEPATGELKATTYENPPGADPEVFPETPNIACERDRSGTVAAVTDATGRRSFERDDHGREIVEHLANGWTVRREHFPDGAQPKSITLIDPEEKEVHHIGYRWNSNATLATVTSASGTFSYTYDERNPKLLASLAGPAVNTGYIYDASRSLLTTVENHLFDANAVDCSGNLIASFHYQYDLGGRPSVVEIKTDLNKQVQTLEYNTRGELTAVNSGGEEKSQDIEDSYIYDAIGNRIRREQQEVVAEYVTNHLNQYKAISANGVSASMTYDPDGNLTQDEHGEYVWGAENTLLEFKSYSGRKVRYTYDYQRRRVAKQSVKRTNQTSVSESSQIEIAIYDNWSALASILGDHRCFYTWGRDRSGRLHGTAGTGGLLATRTIDEGGTDPDKSAYPFYDALGNIQGWVDGVKVAVAHSSYDVFGSPGNVYPRNLHHGYSTKPWDVESGLIYYGYRYLNPETGRWLSRDPIGELGGMNQYEFALNNPISCYDDAGLVVLVDDLTVVVVGTVVVAAYYLVDAVDGGGINGSPLINLAFGLTELFVEAGEGLREIAERVEDLTNVAQQPVSDPKPDPKPDPKRPYPPLPVGSCECSYLWIAGPTPTQIGLKRGLNGYNYQVKAAGENEVLVTTPEGLAKKFDGGFPAGVVGSTTQPEVLYETKYGYGWMNTVPADKWNPTMKGAYLQNNAAFLTEHAIVTRCMKKFEIRVSSSDGVAGMGQHHPFITPFLKHHPVTMP